MAGRYRLGLAAEISALLTAKTTSFLPADWQGDYTVERAGRWIAERDAESATLLAVAKDPISTIGLVILFESTDRTTGALDLRIGYVIAESAWGQGFAGELVEGLVGWARAQGSIRSISGGVASGNPASARVLLKNGFAPVSGAGSDNRAGEQIFELRLPGPPRPQRGTDR